VHMLHVGTAPGVSVADLVSPFSRYSMAPANVLGGPLGPTTSSPYQQQQVSLGQVSPAVTGRMPLVPPVTMVSSRGPAPPPVPPPLPPTLSKGGLQLLPTRQAAVHTAAPAVHVLDASLFDSGSPSAVAAAIAAGVDPGQGQRQGLTERTALLASIRQGGFRLQHVARPSAMARQNESAVSGW
jgi:hypothetical protein